MALPLESGSQEQPGPRMAGDPAILSLATQCLSVDSSAAAAAERSLIHSRSALVSQQSDQTAGRQQGSQQRTLLFFQLSGHELPCGPIPLEGLSTASQTVQLRSPFFLCTDASLHVSCNDSSTCNELTSHCRWKSGQPGLYHRRQRHGCGLLLQCSPGDMAATL